MKAWYALEAVLRLSTEYVREGVVRYRPSLKQRIKDAKAILEEVRTKKRL